MITKPTIAAAALVLSLGLGAAAGAATLNGTETYDLLFRSGTLDDLARRTELVYRREVTNTLNPEAGTRASGDIALSILDGGKPMAQLEFRQNGKHRGLGRFPASVGNPMIMVFYENVVRDMAEAAGGSPYYIRNRVKDALVQSAEMDTGTAVVDGETIETQTVRLYPFAGDPNRDRMQGFGNLELTVVMSEDVPGWYLSLTAEALGEDGAPPVYRSAVVFDTLEPGE